MITKEYYLIHIYYFKKFYYTKKFFNYDNMLKHTIILEKRKKKYIVLRVKGTNKIDITEGINK